MLIKIAEKKRERSFRELSRRDLIKLPTKQNQLKRQYMDEHYGIGHKFTAVCLDNLKAV